MNTTTESGPDLDKFFRQCALAYAYLEQDKVWFPKGRPAIAIADMDAEWRYNASRWLERRAQHFEMHYSMGEIRSLGERTMRAVVGETNGLPVEGGPMLSQFDLMGDASRDAFDSWQDERQRDPLAWIRSTVLYKALIADLPAKPKKLAKLAGRAKHYSTCRVRTEGAEECTCHLSECAIRLGYPEVGCTCRDQSPEWTL